MKILVTGAGGFVGRHLTKELRQAGHEVIMTGLIAETLEGLGRIEVLDISSREHCDRVIQGFKPDAAVHLAGLAHRSGHARGAVRAPAHDWGDGRGGQPCAQRRGRGG